MYHNSLAEGHLGHFHVLVITSNAAMTQLSKCPCGMSVHPLGIYPRVVLLCLDIDLFQIYKKLSYCFPK